LQSLYLNLMRDRYSKVVSAEKQKASVTMQTRVKRMVRDNEIKFNEL